ncbi:MAG: hypothetical protein DRJ69_05620, partial [Thermoprotei archaeon]
MRKAALLAVAAALLLLSSALANPVLARPRVRAEALSKALGSALSRAEALASWLGDAEALSRVEELKEGLTQVKELVEDGSYGEARSQARALLVEVRELLHELYGEAEAQGLVEEAFTKARPLGLELRLRALASRLLEAAQEAGVEDVANTAEEASALIEEGELREAKQCLMEALHQLRRRAAESMALRAMMHAWRCLNHSKAEAGPVLHRLSMVEARLSWVKERLVEVGAGEEAVKAVDKALETLAEVEAHLKSFSPPSWGVKAKLGEA